MMTRPEVSRYFMRVRRVTEEICQPLSHEDQVPQPILDVSPPKWHMGHTSWFFEAVFLDEYIAGYKPFHPNYAFVFNSYYDSFGVRVERPLRGTLSRPTVEEILEYRNYIDRRMCELIDTIEDAAWSEFRDLIVLALNHEQQHQELLVTDIKYILACNPLLPVYRDDLQISDAASQPNLPESAYLEFEGGLYEIGRRGEGFHYDNEGPLHKVHLNDFRLGNRLVTNGDYLEFVEDGGYTDFRHWLSDAWMTVQAENWEAPLYWKNRDGEWYEFTLGGLKKLNPNLPVSHVSYFEADAFAQWTRKRLATEDEWEVAARLSRLESNGANFFDSKNFHPIPLSQEAAGDSESLHQMLGDVWEWTGSAYLPYPGYRRVQGPLGEYNGKFMVNQMVLRGGSCATSEDHIRITYRNFFKPDKRWQFNGLRLAEDG